MGKSLILVSHGLFSEELKKSTEMIMGPQADIHTVTLLPEEMMMKMMNNVLK